MQKINAKHVCLLIEKHIALCCLTTFGYSGMDLTQWGLGLLYTSKAASYGIMCNLRFFVQVGSILIIFCWVLEFWMSPQEWHTVLYWSRKLYDLIIFMIILVKASIPVVLGLALYFHQVLDFVAEILNFLINHFSLIIQELMYHCFFYLSAGY